MVPGNFELKVLGESKSQFDLAMRLVFEAHNKAVGWSVINNKIYLYWHNENCTVLPYPLDVNQATEFTWGWLQNQKPSTSQPDIDGSIHQGFKLEYIDRGWEYYFVSIEKIWTEYHK